MGPKTLNVLILLVLVSMAPSQGMGTATSADNGNPQRWLSISDFAVLATILLALFAFVPILIDMISAHKHLTEMQKSLDEYIRKHAGKIDADKLIKIIHECINANPGEVSGAVHAVMALTITLIVGMGLFFLVAYNPPDSASSSVKEIL